MIFFASLGGAINRPLHDVTVAESQTSVLECEVANPTTEGKWLKDGNPVDFSDNILSENNGAVRQLVIVITRPQDVGEYTYQVANSKTSGNLKVEGKLFFSCKKIIAICISHLLEVLILICHFVFKL